LTTPHEGLFRDNERNNLKEHNSFKNPNWQEANQLAIYKHAKELNSGLPRTTPASAQSGT